MTRNKSHVIVRSCRGIDPGKQQKHSEDKHVDHLDQNTCDWIDEQDGDGFVGIVDGDASDPKEIDYIVVTAEQFISGAVEGNVTVSIAHPLYPELLEASSSATPGYYYEEMDLTFG